MRRKLDELRPELPYFLGFGGGGGAAGREGRGVATSSFSDLVGLGLAGGFDGLISITLSLHFVSLLGTFLI